MHPTNCVPVLLTNPQPEDFLHMAARTKTTSRKRRTSTRKRTTTRRRSPRKRTTSRRRRTTRRRRKNPALDVMGTGVAALGGLVVAGAQYYLDAGTDLDPKMQAAIMAGVGGLGGLALGMVSESAGKGVAGAGLAFAGLALAREMLTPTGGAQTQGMGAVGYAPQLAAVGYAPQLGAIGYDPSIAGQGAYAYPMG